MSQQSAPYPRKLTWNLEIQVFSEDHAKALLQGGIRIVVPNVEPVIERGCETWEEPGETARKGEGNFSHGYGQFCYFEAEQTVTWSRCPGQEARIIGTRFGPWSETECMPPSPDRKTSAAS